MKYDESMIQVVDVVEGMRRQRNMFLTPFLTPDRTVGDYLAGLVAKMAELRGSAPAFVEHRDNWWRVSSQADWLREYSGPEHRDVFHQMVPFPSGGLFAFHPEVLLTAYASVVIDIVGDVIAVRPQAHPIPDAIREWIVPASGRSICFEVTDG